MSNLSRRDLLYAAAALLPATGLAETPGLIIRQKEPENLEFPFDSLNSFLTPNNRFYVRNHFAAPNVERGTYRLRVEGAVERPFEIGYDELLKMRPATAPVTLECAGNSRIFLVPQANGAQWQLGAVSTAEWTGVPLAALLERAGVKSSAVEVVLEGADQGEIRTDPHPPGAFHFARSLPMQKALQPNVLLAHHMNGQELPKAHGFPVRALVPGYYGMASTKWLTRILVVDQVFRGHFQTVDYAYWDRSTGSPTRMPIFDMTVKSLIARPAVREAIRAGTSYKISGAAWTGDADITKVELSADGGNTWAPAQLRDGGARFAWRLWEADWKAPAQPGRYVLMSRATDSRGNTQPSKPDPNFGSYAIHHTVPIEIDVI